jgi:hypoxanthine phosphoribosyltransferase
MPTVFSAGIPIDESSRRVMRHRAEKLNVLISEEQLRKRCRDLGAQITEDYAGEEIHVIGVLKGAAVFVADLIREIDLDVSLDFLGVSSYGSRTESSGVVRMTSDLSVPIQGRHVLIVEDIVDTGLTMKYLLENLQTRMPESLQVCTLLHKPSNARVQVPLKYVGFEIANEFVIGYGLDDAEFSRHLPYIGVVPQSDL